ncbi:protein LIAT1 [Tachyglossus aculeatus]|uniref:protein LIAT1 n=1 Tax=Tachyglossus aculeatus TaxID=9261 RepID=UPI0018F50079|nr:protein LIAT1 [Tachyglossus aculeatus]
MLPPIAPGPQDSGNKRKKKKKKKKKKRPSRALAGEGGRDRRDRDRRDRDRRDRDPGAGGGGPPSPSAQPDKHQSKSWKDQTPSLSAHEMLKPCKASDSKQETTKEIKTNKEDNKHISTPTNSCSTQIVQNLSDQINESLRWDGMLEDPVAEEERIRIYKQNRRKRYRIYALESMCSGPLDTVGSHGILPCLQKNESRTNGSQPVFKTDHPKAYFGGNPGQKDLI